MKTAICTLFEGHYHYGLAALMNSLHKKKFSGSIYAGYRGPIPSWAKGKTKSSNIEGVEVDTLVLSGDLVVHFVALTTDYHFTNYKPDFMLMLWNGPAKDVELMVYMDPDIVVSMNWYGIQDWFKHGVALCEDINSPVLKNHPKRSGWRNYYSKFGVELSFKDSVYVNGGFVGVKKEFRSFIEDWKMLQELMAEEIGGLTRSSLTGQPLKQESVGVFAPFSKTDQDALNATIEFNTHPESIVGKEAMSFISGKALFPHALGTPKPWKNKPLVKGLNGYSPRLVDKLYWNYANGIIKSKSGWTVYQKQLFTRIASFLGRFYGRN